LPIRALAVLLFLAGVLANDLYAQATRVTFVVQQALDDMEEYEVGGAVDWNSSDIEMTSEGGGVQIMGFRFANVTIPQGAVITGAWLQFTADEANSEATTLTIRGEASDNSAQFQNASFTVSSRTRTSASVNWNVPAWSILQEKGDAQKSSDIKSVIQEIINRAGWSSGNAMTMIINGTGKRVAESHEGATAGSPGHDASQAANLIIDYVIPSEFTRRIIASSDDAEQNLTTNAMDLTSSDLELTEDGANQYVGMRWTNVNIPVGAIVTQAYVQFTTDELFPNSASLTIRGFAADNMSTFTSTANDIGARATTVASASWSPEEWTVLQEQGPKQRTTDLTALIQEIVSRGGWASGNAIGIRINGTGKRVAEAFDGSAAEAPTLVVKYYTTAPPDVPWGTFPVTMNSTWRYRDNGADLGTSWRNTNFNDSSWKAGKTQLGYGDGDEATVISFGPSTSARYITSYFRHTFTVNNLASMDSVVFNLIRDDGAVVYLNGVEIYRSNMPAGTITYTTLASSAVGGADESRQFRFSLPKNVLQIGKNVLAVEVHQDAQTSSDKSFALVAEGLKNDVKIISAGSQWKYLDNGYHPGGNWASDGYNDQLWKSGTALFGYGNGGETTLINYGPNPAFKYITTYFRKMVNVADTSGFGSLQLRLKADDGAVIWINGQEAYRYNMPAGNVDQLTLASSFVEGPNEGVWQTIFIDRSLLKPGQNVIGIEVHQNSSTSTDLAFDAELTLLGKVNTLTPVNSIETCGPNAPAAIGCFTSVHPSTKNQILNIPTKTHTWQVFTKSLTDRYTGTNTTMPNGNDFTGFIPYSNGGERSSVRGWVSINHENTPGSVSMVTTNLDMATMTWKVDTIKNVSFADVVTTTRNCSGGVTPWGTVITSEETYNQGDANADGYTDVGWQVEIDPATGKVRDYDGDGKGDKLWAIGRMNHENICVSNDSVTIYQGEDGGTGGLYKFVATQKGNLSQGTLWVLKQDAPNATTGTWILVPNNTKTERNTTSNLAGSLGGTRFGGVEDAEFGPDGMIYFTEKGLGDIWRFKDNGATVSNLEKYVSRANFTIMTDQGPVVEDWNVGIDNLAFDGEGNLWGLQDGGRDHIWVIRPGHTMANPKVELFATTPEGCEPTGLTFSPDSKYGFISMQNPSSANTVVQLDATGKQHVWNASTTLVIGRREHLGPEAIIPAVELGQDIYRCVGDVVTLKNADRNALNVWSIRSSNNSTAQVVGYDSVLTLRESGMVYVTAIGNNGLTKTDSVKVTFNELPNVNLGRDIQICPGDSVFLNAGSFASYTWEDRRTTTQTRVITRPGLYWVGVTTTTGCVAYDSILVTAEPGSVPNLGADLRICEGTTAVLSTGGGFRKYSWNTGDTTATINVQKAGKYWVRTINNRGCEAIDSINVAFLPRPELGPNVTICDGERVTLNAGPGYASYAWNAGGNGQTLLAAKPGVYTVTVTDAQGCIQRDSVVVTVIPLPQVDLGRDTTVEEGKTLTLDAGPGSSFEWNTGARSRSITVSQTGTYTVRVTNSNGCENRDEIDVRFAPAASVDNSYSNENYDLTLYPNPFERDVVVTLDLKKAADYLLEVYDVAGRKISTVGSGSGSGKLDFTISGDALEARDSFYLLKLTVNGKQTSYKLLRKQ
jgi:hypothetical protein